MRGDASKRLAIRGGNWNNGARAGVFALNVNNARSNANTNIGVRPALALSQKLSPRAAADSACTKGRVILGACRNSNQAPPFQ